MLNVREIVEAIAQDHINENGLATDIVRRMPCLTGIDADLGETLQKEFRKLIESRRLKNVLLGS